MDEQEKARAQAEALEATAADRTHRAGVWSGLTRFLAAAARREHTAKQPPAQGRHS